MAPETRYGSSHGRTEADDDLRDVHGDERESDDELARLRAELDDAEATKDNQNELLKACLLYTSPSPRDRTRSRMPSSA